MTRKADTTRVIYKDGKELKLEAPSYARRGNLGALVFAAGQTTSRYIPWEEVRRIDFAER